MTTAKTPGSTRELERAREIETELPPGFTASVMRRVRTAAGVFHF
jgi:hypothetical protein